MPTPKSLNIPGSKPYIIQVKSIYRGLKSDLARGTMSCPSDSMGDGIGRTTLDILKRPLTNCGRGKRQQCDVPGSIYSHRQYSLMFSTVS